MAALVARETVRLTVDGQTLQNVSRLDITAPASGLFDAIIHVHINRGQLTIDEGGRLCLDLTTKL